MNNSKPFIYTVATKVKFFLECIQVYTQPKKLCIDLYITGVRQRHCRRLLHHLRHADHNSMRHGLRQKLAVDALGLKTE